MYLWRVVGRINRVSVVDVNVHDLHHLGYLCQLTQ